MNSNLKSDRLTTRTLEPRPADGARAGHPAKRKSLLKSPVTRVQKVRGQAGAGHFEIKVPPAPHGGVRALAPGLEEAAQGALRVSEIRYRRLFEAARDGVLLIDPDTRKINDVNPFLLQFLGATHEELVGRELWEIGLLKDEQASQEMFRELREKHFVRCEDLPLKTRTGTTREVEVLANLYDEDTHPIVQCHVRDITERKTTENQVRISERRYRRLFQAARDGILILDPETRKITDVNPFMNEFLGYTHEEFLGKELWEIGLLRDERASQEAFRELNEKGYIRYEDLPLLTKTGARREVEFVSNRYTENNRPVVQCNIRDITERKRAEQELVAAKNEISRHAIKLEETVTERTAQLRETIGELEAFSYSISHDMRTPLRAMQGFAGILAEKHAAQLDADALKYLERIRDAAGRMDSLIQDVLTYTRVLRAEVTNEPVDLDVLVRQLLEIYPQLQTGDAEIQIHGLLPKVLGGEASLAQCLSNLLTNAVKFVAPGTKPVVRVWAEEIPPKVNSPPVLQKNEPEESGTQDAHAPEPLLPTPDSPLVRLWVEDNGIGIAPSDHVRIFNMFETVGRATAYEGTGMGLTIVRKAVERMGGQIGIESGIGQGSRFWIQLQGVSP